ncbi:flavodoxin domain-containing protein [Lentisalinibacter salinarum]|uniref:flavodoxin domain-containing protein n=1 Tax=Lentisalinibacter salinarum TaxID=2992239 RepID=UPI0038638550
MKRFLLLYATREGQTAKVAERIAGQLRAAGAEVTLIDAANTLTADALELARFDRLVFGASMHAGGLEKELVGFINGHADGVRRQARSLFVVLLSAAAKDPALREEWLGDARDKIESQLRVPFEHVEMIAGALSYSKYPLPLRWMMRRIARKAGGDTDTSRDYEYTDWEQVRRYAQSLLED